jgi:hypothetical protein
LELQAPQGPYTNVLELQVFPAMSKKHSELLQIYSNTQADNERIWKIALEIWNGTTSAMIARALILAYRIMKQIIETKGATEWLKDGTPHCHVRRVFWIRIEVSCDYLTLLMFQMMRLHRHSLIDSLACLLLPHM